MTPPTLVLVSGGPGVGKTVLAGTLSEHLGLPVFAHDAVRAGVAATVGAHDVDTARALGPRAWGAYYGLLQHLVTVGVSLIAGAHFQRGRSESELTPLVERSRSVLVHCVAPRDVIVERVRLRRADPRRSRRFLVGDDGVLQRMESGGFEWHVHEEPMDLPVPTLVVDTSLGADSGHIEQFIASAIGSTEAPQA